MSVIRLLPHFCEACVGDHRVALSPAEYQLLRVLTEQRRQVVTRTALMIAAWGAANPERIALLEDHMISLRARLGETVKIETMPGIGYRLA